MSTEIGRVHPGTDPLPAEALTVIAARWEGSGEEQTYVRLADDGKSDNSHPDYNDVWFCIEDRIQWDLHDVVAEWRILALPISDLNQEAFHAAPHE